MLMMIIIIIRALALNMMQQPFKWFSPTTAFIRFLSEDIYFNRSKQKNYIRMHANYADEDADSDDDVDDV